MSDVLFTVEWKNGRDSISNLVSRYCKNNGIQFRWNHYFQQEVLINDEWIPTDYISDSSTNIVKIIRRGVKV